MKPYIFFILYSLLTLTALNISSCDKMDDIQKKFADEEEKIYLGKVDSVKVIPGFGRVRLTWEISADPRIDLVKIYWNDKNDSTYKAFDRSTSGIVKDSLVIDNLTEGNYNFELKAENEKGSGSLSSYASGSVWGPNRGDELGGRSITKFDLNRDESTYKLQLSPVQKVNEEDSLVFSEIFYVNNNGTENLIRVSRDSVNLVLDNIPEGAEFTLRDAFVSSRVIDTVYNNYRLFTVPSIINDAGHKLSVSGNTSSKYIAVDDSVFYEWKENGDVLAYVLENNDIQQHETIAIGAFSRDSFRAFFYNGNNKFIAASTNGDITMYDLTGDSLVNVLNPDGASVFGSGFSFSKFVRGNGLFYTVTSESGDLQTWDALDNATWGSPNGTTVGTNFDKYRVLLLFNSRLLGIDQEGFLWSISLKADGSPDVFKKIGSGWDRFKTMVAVGNKLLCLDQSGDFYLFDDIYTEQGFWVIE